jgi:hypothetical protein
LGTSYATRDYTTWGEAGEGSRIEIEEDPPRQHAGLEEEDARVGVAPEHGVASFAKDNDDAKLPTFGHSTEIRSYL